MKAAPDESRFFSNTIKIPWTYLKRVTIIPLKSRIDAMQKLQSYSNKKKYKNFLEG